MIEKHINKYCRTLMSHAFVKNFKPFNCDTSDNVVVVSSLLIVVIASAMVVSVAVVAMVAVVARHRQNARNCFYFF